MIGREPTTDSSLAQDTPAAMDKAGASARIRLRYAGMTSSIICGLTAMTSKSNASPSTVSADLKIFTRGSEKLVAGSTTEKDVPGSSTQRVSSEAPMFPQPIINTRIESPWINAPDICSFYLEFKLLSQELLWQILKCHTWNGYIWRMFHYFRPQAASHALSLILCALIALRNAPTQPRS